MRSRNRDARRPTGYRVAASAALDGSVGEARRPASWDALLSSGWERISRAPKSASLTSHF